MVIAVVRGRVIGPVGVGIVLFVVAVTNAAIAGESIMALLRYVVGPDDAGGWQIWQINSTNKVLGRYTTRARAVRAAVDTAQAAGETNPDGAQVLVQSRVDQFRIEWTFGDDPYPPPAAVRDRALSKRSAFRGLKCRA